MRLYMALWLACYYFLRPWRLREIFILRDWRRLREERFCTAEENFYELQLAELSRRYQTPAGRVEEILRAWLTIRPKKILRFCVRKKVLAIVKAHQLRGVKMIVYSDNPVREKLSAINFSPDASFCADELRCMKPDAHGLIKILTTLELAPDDVLYIGDRDDRDGLCAKASGVNYLDIKNFEALL
ncbi:MAG: HAD family hydrolase [Quinella sp. 1Q5]|nr:HAD family hydrolase [Quinella sp. 1Q5]